MSFEVVPTDIGMRSACASAEMLAVVLAPTKTPSERGGGVTL